MILGRFLIFLVFLTGFYALRSQTIDTFVQLNNHQLHFNIIEGNGVPILFESGNGDDGSVWKSLLNDIHNKTGAPIITYDRAGLGESTLDTNNHSFQNEIDDLIEALNSLNYNSYFFLVAHSFGSYYASEFALKFPGSITGAVFIDVSTPCSMDTIYATKVRQTISEADWKMIKQYKLGLYHVLQNLTSIASYMSDRFITDSIPVTVIAADIRVPTRQIGETDQDMIQMTECLKAFGNSGNNRYLIIKGSGHKVWKKDPERVVEEIVQQYKLSTTEISNTFK